MNKAKLKNGFILLEVFGGMEIDDYDDNDFTYFSEGDEVLVLMEFEDKDGEPQCVIFSEEIEESTTVSSLLLEFID